MKKLSFAFTVVIIVIILQLVKRSRSNVYWPQKDCLVIKRKKDPYTNHTHQPHKMPCLLLDIHFSWVLKYLSRHSYQNLLSSAYINIYCQISQNFETSSLRQSSTGWTPLIEILYQGSNAMQKIGNTWIVSDLK